MSDSQPLSRRTVTRGLVWSAPIAVVAGQAPAIAASMIFTFTRTGFTVVANNKTGFKNWGELTGTLTNLTNGTVTVRASGGQFLVGGRLTSSYVLAGAESSSVTIMVPPAGYGTSVTITLTSGPQTETVTVTF